MNELTPVRRERIQNRITKVIVSDEPRKNLEAIISANEISEAVAEEMVRNARKNRIDIIRGIGMRKVWVGGAVMSIGIGALYIFLLLVGTLTKAIWMLGGLIAVMGFGMILGGLAAILMAPAKRGSFIDHL